MVSHTDRPTIMTINGNVNAAVGLMAHAVGTCMHVGAAEIILL